MPEYVPIEDFINPDLDQSSLPIRPYPPGKSRFYINLYPDTLSFEDTVSGEESFTRTVLMQNTGLDNIVIEDIILVGDFELVTTKPLKLKIGETMGIELKFTPNKVGVITGGMYIDAKRAEGERFVSLTGSGIED